MRIRDLQVRSFVQQLQAQARPALTDENVLGLLAAVGDTNLKSSRQVLGELTRPGITRQQQFELARAGLSNNERRDITTVLDQSGWQMSDGARNFLEALIGRAQLKAGFGPLQIVGDQRDGIRGTAKPGDVIEAINLTTAPDGRLHLTDTVEIGRADGGGRFAGRLPDVREGDVLRLRARSADGEVSDWVTIKARGIEAGDFRNARINLERIDLASENGGISATHNTPRPISEPGAEVRFLNQRTGRSWTVTITDAGSLPPGVRLEGAPGDAFSVAVSDKVNNRNFAEVAGVLRVPGGRGGGNGVDLPDPKPLKSDSREDGTPRVGTERFTGPLFVDGPSPADVRQGAIGNCYFPAALAAIAHHRPRFIEQAIRENGDGTFSVRFYENGNKRRPVDITVDADLYVRSWGGPLYGSTPERATRTEMELWYPLIEKAYAEWKGGYEATGNGGVAGRVMSEMMGAEYDWQSVNEANAGRMFDYIKRNAALDRPMAAGTHGKDQAARYVNSGIYANHAYSVLGVEEQNGVKYVRLRNPWGQSEPGWDGKNDGFFRLELEKFGKLYSSLHTVMV